MKYLAFVMCMIICTHSYSQTVFLADTALVTDVGYMGAPASCKTNGMVYSSVNMDRKNGVWVADAFTIPTATTWMFDTIIVFGYQFGSGLSSPFTGCNLQIYNGTPGSGGVVIWGDTITNRLSNSAFTGIYKVDTFSASGGLLSTTRPIMYLKLFLFPAPNLSSGTYWLSWSATCATTTSSATTPYKVLPGRINPPGQISKLYNGSSWIDVIDNGSNVGLNKIIKASSKVFITSTSNYPADLLCQNVPNPFNKTTVISYTVTENSNVKIVVFNSLGEIVSTLVDYKMNRGEYKFTFDANNLPGGIYYYRLSTSKGTIYKQMIIAK